MPETSAPFLSGGGKMGALVRAMDWSKTALGPVDRWPQSLRTSVSTCLNSRFPILIWWGGELAMVYNDAYRPILGDKHPRALGQRGRDCWPEIWHVIGPMLHAVLERGEATWSENQMLPLERRGFPEECYFTFSYSPIHEEGGGVGGVFCAVTETTRQVLAERRLRSLREVADEAALASSERGICERAAHVLARNPDDTPFALAFLCSRDGRTARLVAAAGVAVDVDAAAMELDAPECPWPFVEASVRRKPVRVEPLPATVAAQLAAGGALPKGALVLPFGPLGAPSGFLVAGLSPRLVLDEEYRGYLEALAARLGIAVAGARALDDATERAQRLAEIDHAKTAFFSNVSHEFRTPLTLMLGPFEDALTQPPHALQGDALRSAYRSTLRLLKLVNALLDFSRIEAGRMQGRFEPVRIADFTRDIASAMRTTIEHAGLRFDVDCEGDDVAAVDRDMWEKVVLNLLSNAFKFTLRGHIRVSLAQDGGTVRLAVEDTGTGIAPQDLGRLFQRFQRIDNPAARTAEGSGIGLALVQELVQIHGGRVGVASEPGRGTTFTVEIPRERPGMAAAAGSAPAAAPTRAAAFVEEAMGWNHDASPVIHSPEPAPPMSLDRDRRVLVADDNADMRAYLARLLSPHWEVECAADGEAALRALDRQRFDLVVSDVMMPRMDGFALLDAIRRRKDAHATRVVLLSARAGEEARIEGLEAGADDYIVKPFSGRELVARVRSQLLLQQARQDMAIERMQLLAREELARRELEMQRDHFRRLLSEAATPMCILKGPRHVVQLANDEMCRAWNLCAGQVIDRPLFEAMPELRGQEFEEQLDGVLRTGQAYIGRRRPVRVGTGRPRYYDYLYTPLRDAEGAVEGVLVMAFDVTDALEAPAP